MTPYFNARSIYDKHPIDTFRGVELW